MLSSKVTGALAWGGLALILAVPSADFISAKVGGGAAQPAPAAAAPDMMTTAAIDGVDVPVVKAAPVPLKGKPMPRYISDPETPAATAPVKTVEPKAEVATVVPDAVPPVPMPAHMRPLPPPVATAPSVQPIVAQPTPQVAAISPVTAGGVPAQQDQPLILDESQVRANEAALGQQPNQPRPKADVPRPPANVTEEDLQDWDSGSLSDYLERRGLLSDATYTESRSNADEPVDENYDPDGFYLSDGPNGRRARRDGDDSFIVFPQN